MKLIPSELKIKSMTSSRIRETWVKISCFLLYSFFMSSCMDFKAVEPIKKIPLSRSHLSFFDTCYPSEGGGRVIWLKEKAPLAEGRLDWIASKQLSWQTQLSDPFGMILLDLKWAKSPPAFRQEGKLLRKIPDLTVNSKGFWEANGMMIGLKPEEVPCLLKAKFPGSWREMIYKREGNRKNSTVYISELSRKIDITFHRSAKGSYEACALLQWNQFWGIKTGKINWCINRNDTKSRLDMPDEQTLIWENTDA